MVVEVLGDRLEVTLGQEVVVGRLACRVLVEGVVVSAHFPGCGVEPDLMAWRRDQAGGEEQEVVMPVAIAELVEAAVPLAVEPLLAALWQRHLAEWRESREC